METVEVVQREPRRESTKRKAVLGGSAVESIAGVGAVVLSIIALSGRLMIPLAAISVIAAGAALLFEAAAVGAEETESDTLEGTRARSMVKSAIGADTIAGLAAIALGILALIGIAPLVLLPVAAIVLGAGLLLSAAVPEEESVVGEYEGHPEFTRNAKRATSGVHLLVGAGAVVLGILGVLGNSPLVLTLISTLSIGAAELLTGVSVGAPLARRFRYGT
jgi:hypothetical protein